ncbi:MAG: aspartate-semialdehyde dehydrogenase [Nitrososphaerales archaeon]|jgi:aspartate-semialdehyde dehydrogenase|nr:aspartate-semialdehyde dehydrogenase [Nitrososphaerales archaeon]|tara:strand:+ start:277 stop:1353 length:1077 start_codon:yes stop_codon:yes gene_type:complete
MKKTAIVGATGIVGQQFLAALNNHPWLEITTLAASVRSAGKKYKEALLDPKTQALHWYVEKDPPAEFLDMEVENAANLDPSKFDVIFTAIESDQAKTLEPKFAKESPVISTASAFRYDSDIPIIIPGINSDHISLLDIQRKKRRWDGFIIPIPNCTTTGLAISLKPIKDTFGLRSVIMTSMQAVSGAGRSPGVGALDITDNVIPFIPNEEQKVQEETRKILGVLGDGCVEPANFNISCTCTRVNVLDGHTESVFASTKEKCSVKGIKETLEKYTGILKDARLPSSPKKLIVVQKDPYRPQPRLDRDAYGGMATTVGRIRVDDVLKNGVKYLLVTHNTKMGAAKGAVLLSELLIKKGYI